MKRLLIPIVLAASALFAADVPTPLRVAVIYQASAPSPLTCVLNQSPAVFVTASGCTWYCSAGTYTEKCPEGTAANPGGSQLDVQVHSTSDTLGSAPGFTADTTTGAVETKIINGQRIGRKYATAGAGTSGSPYTGWEGAITAGKGRVLFTGNADGTTAYYDVPDAGITVPSDVEIAGDGNAVLTWGTARASVNPMLIIPHTSSHVTIEGLRFEPGVSVPQCGLGDGTGGAGFIRIGTANNATPASYVSIRKNAFGVMRYSDGGDGCSPSDPVGTDIFIVGSSSFLTIEDNTFDASPTGIMAQNADPSVALTNTDLSIQRNRFTYSQTDTDYGYTIQLGGGYTDMTGIVEATLVRANITDNFGYNGNGSIRVSMAYQAVNVERNNYQSDNMDFCVDAGAASNSTAVRSGLSVIGNVCTSDTAPHNGSAPGTTTHNASILVSGAAGGLAFGAVVSGNSVYGIPAGAGTFGIVRMSNVTGAVISGNNADLDAPSGAIDTSCYSIQDSTGVTVTGNVCRNTAGYGFAVFSSAITPSGIKISGNQVYDSAGTATTQYLASATTCNGCSVTDNAYYGVTAPTAGLLSVSASTTQNGNVGYTGSTLATAATFAGSTFTATGAFLSTEAGVTHLTGAAGSAFYAGDRIVSEGATAGAIEGTILFPDWSGTDSSYTFPAPGTTGSYLALVAAATGAIANTDVSGLGSFATVSNVPTNGLDAATDVSTALCADGQILKKTAGSWACGTDDTTGGGAVTLTGSPATNQLTFWSGTSTITGDTGITVDGTANSVTATTFIGALTGNASGSAASFTGSLAGDVTGTQGATIVGDDSHAHTSTTISGLDISADTNLAVTAPITLTGNSVGIVNQGTTTTLLHGNAAGNASFGAVVAGDIGSDAVTPDKVLTAGQTDELCLTYEVTGDTWEWQTCGSGGGIATVEENNATVTTSATNLDFLGADFDVTGATVEADVAIAAAITRDAEVTTADAAGDATTFPLLGLAATGFQAPATDAGLTYDATTNILTAGEFNAPASATSGGSLVLKEDSDLGASTFTLTLGASNLSADATCTIDTNGRIPDSCVGDGTDGGGGNSFETQNAPSGTDPVADSSTDTLNWTATAPITITGDSSTDTLTVAVASAAASTLGVIELDTDLAGTAGAPTIAADAVALTTDTTGNYVQSVATTSPLSGGAAGSEGAALTLTIANAAADGATKGAASFAAADFDAATGNITLDATVSKDAEVTGVYAASNRTNFVTRTNTAASVAWSTFGSGTGDADYYKRFDPSDAANESGIVWSSKYQVYLGLRNGATRLYIFPADFTSFAASTIKSVDLADVDLDGGGGACSSGATYSEGIALTSPDGDYFYVSTESIPSGTGCMGIIEYSIPAALTASGTLAPTTTWRLDNLNGGSCALGNNGFESVAFVPDGVNCPAEYTNIPCGLFYTSCQGSDNIFRVLLDKSAGTPTSTLIGSVIASPCGADYAAGMGMDYDWKTGLLWQSYGSSVEVFTPEGACVQTITSLPTTDSEGFAFGPGNQVIFGDDTNGYWHVSYLNEGGSYGGWNEDAAGQLKLRVDCAATTDPKSEGEMCWDIDNDFAHVYDGSADHTLVDTNSAQTISGAKTLTGALTLGAGTDADYTITVDQGTGTDPTIMWDDSEGYFLFGTSDLAFTEPGSGGQHGTYWPVTSPVTTKMFSGMSSEPFNGNLDHIICWSYNSLDCTGARINTSEHQSKIQLEATYDSSASALRQDFVEWNWDFTSAIGNSWRPFYAPLDTTKRTNGQGLFEWRLFSAAVGTNALRYKTFTDTDAITTLQVNTRDADAGSMFGIVNANVHSADLAAQTSLYGADYQVIGDQAADYTASEFVGARSSATFNSGTASSGVATLVGGRATAQYSGSAATRSVDDLVGFQARAINDQTGTGSVSTRLHGIDVTLTPTGQNQTFAEMYGINIAAPGAKHASSAFTNVAAIYIGNFGTVGTNTDAVINVASQTANHYHKGNIWMQGGDYNTGHLQLGNGDLWYDGSAAIYRVGLNNTALNSPRYAHAIVTGSNPYGDTEATHNVVWGPVLWAKASTSCQTACTNGGLYCEDAYPIAGGAALGCADTSAVAKTCMCK